MTEDEAKVIFTTFCKGCCKPLDEAHSIANKALEEVQQYREIGTIEECRAAMDKEYRFTVAAIAVSITIFLMWIAFIVVLGVMHEKGIDVTWFKYW